MPSPHNGNSQYKGDERNNASAAFTPMGSVNDNGDDSWDSRSRRVSGSLPTVEEDTDSCDGKTASRSRFLASMALASDQSWV